MSRCLLLIVTAALTLAGGRAAAQLHVHRPRPIRLRPAPAAGTGSAPTTPAPTTRCAGARAAPRPRSHAARGGRATTPTQAEYRIGSGDKLQINVYKETDLTQALQVRPDGRITMPLIGDLAAAGQTPMQLQRRLAESLREYVSNPGRDGDGRRGRRARRST